MKQQGIDYLFGVVGFPITAFAAAAQKAGIQYIGMRNEQAASYAAQAAGYLTGRPQAVTVVSGPGVIHAIAGLANAQQNCWPMLLIGGASAVFQNGRGAFQDPTNRSFWNLNSFWYYTRGQQAQSVPGIRCRFQGTRIWQAFPTEWHQTHDIPYVYADLVALKGVHVDRARFS